MLKVVGKGGGRASADEFSNHEFDTTDKTNQNSEAGLVLGSGFWQLVGYFRLYKRSALSATKVQ